MLYELDGIVRVKMFGNVWQKHGGWHNGIKHPTNIVLYCTEGKINMQAGKKLFELESGDILLIPRDTLYRPLAGGSCRYYFFHFEANTPSDTENIPYSMIIAPHAGLSNGYAYTCMNNYHSVINVPMLIKSAPHYMTDIFKRAEQLQPNANFSDQLLLNNSLQELLIHMAKPNSPQYSKRLTQILDYIENHYSERLSLSILSRRFSLSQSYIARLFKQELFQRPSEYINGVRISVAKTMLLETDLTITEIAEKVGFSDNCYFSKVFKQIVGVPPLRIRNVGMNA